MAEKIINFPSVASPGVTADVRPQLNQHAFFGPEKRPTNRFVIFNLDQLDQDKLANLIVKNSVSSIFDLRSKPVFERPRFDHKKLLRYFDRYRISYADIPYFMHLARSDRDVFDRDPVRARCLEALRSGLLLIISDANGADDDSLQKVRKTLNNLDPSAVEVAPSSLST